jgi:hypothetical protein
MPLTSMNSISQIFKVVVYSKTYNICHVTMCSPPAVVVYSKTYNICHPTKLD